MNILPRRFAFIGVLVCILVLISGCSKTTISVPAPMTSLEPAPEEAVALTLWQEFKADEATALSKYADRTLHFAHVVVDKMTFLGEGGDTELFVQEGIDPNIEQVKFKTDTAFDILNARETYVVEIVGKVQGMQFGYLIVHILWLKVIDPPGGDTKPPPEY